MTTIAEENRKHLRQALKVECGLRESGEEPTSLDPVGYDSDYAGLQNLSREYQTVVLMDLAGSGFVNNGQAIPMETNTDSYRYGFISESAAKADGTFADPFGITLEATENWKEVTLEVMDQSGNSRVMILEPIWIGGQTTVYVDSFTPGERAYIVGVHLGKAWIWNSENLLGVSLDLHGVSTEIGGELEVSSIEIRAYEPTDYTDVIGDIPLGAPIWYTAGYDEDMSPLRKFYLSEIIDWEDNVLTVRGQDATSLLEGQMVPWQWYTVNAGNSVTWIIEDMLQRALEQVDYTVIGTEPGLTDGNTNDVYFEDLAPRTIISILTGLFRDPNYVRVTYVDAGIPVLTWGNVANRHTIYADEISELNVTVEQNINEIDANIATYEEGSLEELTRINAVANRTYFVNFEEPVTYIEWTPDVKSQEFVGYRSWKFVAKYTREYVISSKNLETVIVDGDNPYKATSSLQGITYAYDDVLQSFPITDGSLTKLSLPMLLERSNKIFEFTYRGEPHIQPRDVLDVEIATWVDDRETIDGLFPATDLYPASDLYPYAEYKNTRKMVKTWETMTVDTVTLEHTEGGGLSSKIKARKGVV